MTAGALLEEPTTMTDDDRQVEVLKDQYGRRVTRAGDVVWRQTSWWTPAVHRLLDHLQERGFPYSPRVLDPPTGGRERLRYIDGEAGAAGWSRVVDPEGLHEFAAMLRAYHDAVRDFRPREDSVWACATRQPGYGEIVCHGDFGPWNVVWRDGHAVGILDWDFAGPGRPMDDIAYALEYCAPFRDDGSAMRWMGYASPPDRRARLATFFDGYGSYVPPDIVDQVASRQLLDISRVQLLAARGVQPQATWVTTGLIDELHKRARWTVEHRHLFQ